MIRAPLSPFGPDPWRMADAPLRGSKIRTRPSLQTVAIKAPQGLQAIPKIFEKNKEFNFFLSFK
jgi:hypothetical protein